MSEMQQITRRKLKVIVPLVIILSTINLVHMNLAYGMMELTVQFTCEQTEIPLSKLEIEFNRTYGLGEVTAVIEPLEGGITFAGYTWPSGATNSDMYLVHTDNHGVVLWSQTYGTSREQEAHALIQTQDGGYLLAGYTYTYLHVYDVFQGDVWLVKTNSVGIMQWNLTYGNIGHENAHDLLQTAEGDYLVAGHQYQDFFLLKIDPTGTLLWNHTYGDTFTQRAYSLIPTSDGGFALTGTSTHYGMEIIRDIWFVKTDRNGLPLINRSYGGVAVESAFTLIETSDKGYILAGSRGTEDTGSMDLWLMKIDSAGVEKWNYTYGGSGDDKVSDIVQSKDGGYLIGGNKAGDMWLGKIDELGQIRWNSSIGGSEWDYATAVAQTEDGAILLAGGTRSFGAEAGVLSTWLVKLGIPRNDPIPPNVIFGGVIFLGSSVGVVVLFFIQRKRLV